MEVAGKESGGEFQASGSGEVAVEGSGKSAGGKWLNPPPWQREGYKRPPLPKATQRRRNNARIKRMVAPKPPVQVLNELVGPENVQTNLSPPARVQGAPVPMITAEINVEGKTFSGCGPTRSIAKNIAAEAAIHHMATVMANDPHDCEIYPDGQRNPYEDSTPWAALASLALFKLFTDWQANGYPLPAEITGKEFPGGALTHPAPLGLGEEDQEEEGVGGKRAKLEDEETTGEWEGNESKEMAEEEGWAAEGEEEGFQAEYGIMGGFTHNFAEETGAFREFDVGGRQGGGGAWGGRGGRRGRGGPFPPMMGRQPMGQMGHWGPMQMMNSARFPGYPEMEAPQPATIHPITLLHQKLGSSAKIDYCFQEEGETPQTKKYTCTLTLGMEGCPEFVGRKGAPVGIFTAVSGSKKEAKKLAAVECLRKNFGHKGSLIPSRATLRELSTRPEKDPAEKIVANIE